MTSPEQSARATCINSAIAQHRIGRVEPFARDLCHRLLDGLLERGGGDLVAEYVMPIPARVIAHLLGADAADYDRFAEWSDVVVQSTYATKNRREDGVAGEGLADVKVAFGLASANRDEHTYDDPNAFKVDRPSARDHLAFGGGPHVCPGASLARLEGRIALEVFLDRVASAQLSEGYTRHPVPVFWANGPRALSVRLRSSLHAPPGTGAISGTNRI